MCKISESLKADSEEELDMLGGGLFHLEQDSGISVKWLNKYQVIG